MTPAGGGKATSLCLFEECIPTRSNNNNNANTQKGARTEGALTGVRALALLHVVAGHAVVVACAHGADFSTLFSAANAHNVVLEFFTSWPAQPVMAADVGVDAFFTLSRGARGGG